MISKKEFEELVEKAIKELPFYFREKMDNIAIYIEDLPSQDIVQKLGYKSPYSLLGIYQGVPITHRGIHYRNVMPDRITIFRKSILRKNNNIADLKNDIKRVVMHEIGHYFGLNDHDLFLIEKEHFKRNNSSDDS